MARLSGLIALCLLLSTAAYAKDLPGLDGDILQEDVLEAQPTILIVWTTWSPRCRDVVQRVNAIHQRWAGKALVATVVFQEEPEDIRLFLDRQKAQGNALQASVYLDRDGSFSKENSVTSLPGLIILKRGDPAFRGKLPADPHPLIERTLR